MSDREVEAALARSFLAGLPPEVTRELQAEGERIDPAAATVYRAGSGPQAALVVGGLLRVYLTSLEGRQVTVRYVRHGEVLGSRCWWAGRPAPASRRWSRRACSGSAGGR